MENAWQYAKVYRDQLDPQGKPTMGYWAWAQAGWVSTMAHRYPRGRGTAPAFSVWKVNGQIRHLSYLEARREIYIPLYAAAVQKTLAWKTLLKTYQEHATTGRKLALWDFDGYDHRALGMKLTDVATSPTRKMGHAFILFHLLTKEPFYE